ncbi:hypothetical protein [Xanthomonas arboricola]|uniref:hypothetical protein n=1 Tax=Xanthomonas arboricola TaxID=56448 RepID=UPI00161C8941|nr:hypothetical protein [Xanthomonas arboricola]MBB5676414.1 hypothetical protein [Xanthomonas arboricola]
METDTTLPTADRNNGADTASRDRQGRFGPGNPGRRRGARNKTTLAAMALLEKDSKRLTKKAIDMALAGDAAALRLCLERIAPPTRERVIQVDLPIPQTPADVPTTMRAILAAAAEGTITAGEAERLGRCVEGFARAHELADFDARLRALEGKDAR